MVKGLGIKMGDRPTRKQGLPIDSELFEELEYIVIGDNLIINDYRSGRRGTRSSGTLTIMRSSMSGFIDELTEIYETYLKQD